MSLLPSRGSRRTTVVALLACASLASEAWATSAEIRLIVTEHDGPPIADRRVSLVPQTPVTGLRGSPGVRTDREGVARWAGIPPGRYTFDVHLDPGDPYVRPRDNPFVAVPVATVDAGDRVELALELWRGVPVAVRASIDTGELPHLRFVATNAETGATIERRLDVTGARDVVVPAGQWDFRLRVPPGFRIADLARNGDPLVGHVARVDATRDYREQTLEWSLVAPSTVEGEVRGGPVQVVATLLEPGPWGPGAAARGGMNLERVPARGGVPPEYEIRLQDGTWRVAPQSPALLRSDPPHVDVRLVPGEVRRIDFDVELEEGERGPAIRVLVRDEHGDLVEGAIAELHPAGTGDGDPLDTDRLERYDLPRLVPPGPGDYLVVAGHERHLPASTVVRDFDPDVAEGRMVGLVLPAGGEVRAKARSGEEGEPTPGVEFGFERLDGAPDPPPANPELAERETRRTTRTDATGWAVHEGLHPGTYRFEARVLGERGRSRFVDVRVPGESPAPSVERTLTEASRERLELIVRDGASLAGSVACDDRGPFPKAVSFRVAPVELDWDTWLDEREPGAPGTREADRAARTLAIDEQPLEGRDLDRFFVGPLEPGAYRFASRGAGHEAWSWGFGDVPRESSAILQLRDGEPVELGTIALACGPRLRIEPRLRSGEPLPDLRDGALVAEGDVRFDDGSEAPLEIVATATDDAWTITGLLEGEVDLVAVLEHPYLVPARHEERLEAFAIARGEVAVRRPFFSRAGGAIDFDGADRWVALEIAGPLEEPGDGGSGNRGARPEAAANGVTAPEGPRIVPLEAGAAFVGGLVPGTYRVRTCGDPACARGPDEGRTVDVRPLRTTHIAIDPATK